MNKLCKTSVYRTSDVDQSWLTLEGRKKKKETRKGIKRKETKEDEKKKRDKSK